MKSPLDKAAGYEVVWQQVSTLFEAARRIQDMQFVYFIGEPDDGPVKIGTTKDPIARLRKMQTGNPRRLRIEHVLVGDESVEKLLHEFWGSHAIYAPHRRAKAMTPGTEWFEPTIRAELFPIIETATEHQAAFLTEAKGDIPIDSLERLVRQAHIALGFIAKRYDEGRLLAAGAGYVVRRPSRI